MVEPQTTISIDGQTLSTFEHIHLTQGINDHHHFELVVDIETIEQLGAHTIDASKDWLGKSIVINFKDKEFLGVIVDLKMVHRNGFNGRIIITGYSQSILLEGGKHMQSWLDKDLGSIVNDVIDAAGIDAAVKPVYTAPFEYQAQYNETHFQFLQRLAKQHNEWLYYDGTKLIFGKPSLEDATDLEYGADIDSISISIAATPNKQGHFSYNSLEDKRETTESKDAVGGLSELGDFAFNVSKSLFGIIPNSYSNARVMDKDQIDSVVKNKQESAAAQSNVLRATSTKQGLGVGSVVKVTSAILDNSNAEIKNHGEYIITNITHYATGAFEYSNQFEAISSGVVQLPEPLVEMPNAESQIATVLSNEDPKKKGRVEVQFQWQTGDMKTAWIRVMTPDAGQSDTVGVNRGYVFIPEEGDEVMVGFRYSDPNRPFVMGSMFNGTTGAGGSDANKAKSITTRSGSTIIFDDDANDGNITIIDAAQNMIALDGKGVVAIKANDQISLHVGKSGLIMDKDGNITVKGEIIQVKGEQEIVMVASKGEAEGSGVSLDPKQAAVTAPSDLVLTGKKEASLSSKTVTVGGETEVNVAGGKINLN